jgi:AcrR family transcriptional regulator
MARRYTLKRRLEQQQQTKLRIVEAAVELHRTKGPAATTISDIARRAGVERHTLYRHFADEREIGLACSGLFMERNPPPDAGRWLDLPEREERWRHGLTNLYAWYASVHEMLSAVFRDAESDPLTREMFELRAGDAMARIRAALAHGLPRGRRAQSALDLALDFYTWRRLTRSGLTPAESAHLMTGLLCRVSRNPASRAR